MPVNASLIKRIALAQGFDLAGLTPAVRADPEASWYQNWVERGLAGSMRYLTDRRAILRNEPNSLLPSARSILSVAKRYNTSDPGRTDVISRYAQGEDYHVVLRRRLEAVVNELRRYADFGYRICVDTAPLLERAYARRAGLGWIGKNTCLINQMQGSWLFLGEVLLSVELEPDSPPPDRCGTCRRCIDACPTEALVEIEGRWELDSRLCISYLTIEHRGEIDPALRPGMGNHVFGCDICQDVCPWNRRAPVTEDAAFRPQREVPPLESLAALDRAEFRQMFSGTPVARAKHAGFLRNICIAMGNSGDAKFQQPLELLARSKEPMVAQHAQWALGKLIEGSAAGPIAIRSEHEGS